MFILKEEKLVRIKKETWLRLCKRKVYPELGNFDLVIVDLLDKVKE